MKTNNEADLEDSKPPDKEQESNPPPAKRPRRKAALKSEERTAEIAVECDTKESPVAKRPRRKKAALKSEEADDNASKKKRCESAPIPVDAMVNVMEFLPPRSLYNIALTCKPLREMVTVKMVVQSALIHGGNPKKTMEELYALMRAHSMHIPSPLRLLRLVNSKTCEFCLTSGTNHVRPGLGVFACWDCVSSNNNRWSRGNKRSSGEKLTKAWKTSWSRFKHKPIYRTILSHPRVASNGYGANHYFWSQHRTDVTGEKVGPICSWADVDDLSNYYDGLKAAAAAKEATAAAAAASTSADVAASMPLANTAGDDDEEEEEEEEEAAPSLTNGEWIDYYLTKNLNAPPKEDYAEFNEAFINTVQMAERVATEREELKKSKRDDKKQSKIAKVEKMLDDLTALTDEPFRECAFLTSGKESYLTSVATRPCVCLQTPFINTWLEPYINAPSKMNKKVMKEMAEKINSELHRVEILLEMDFLSDDDEFEAAAKIFFRECFPDLESLFISESSYRGLVNKLSVEVLALMQAGRFLGALCYLKNRDLSPMLLATEPSASLARSATYLDESSLNKIAKKAWDQSCPSDYPAWYTIKDGKDDKWVAETFAAGHTFFGEALAKIQKFGHWLSEGKVEDEDKRAAFQNEIPKVYTWGFASDFMKEEDFGKILERITRMSNL